MICCSRLVPACLACIGSFAMSGAEPVIRWRETEGEYIKESLDGERVLSQWTYEKKANYSSWLSTHWAHVKPTIADAVVKALREGQLQVTGLQLDRHDAKAAKVRVASSGVGFFFVAGKVIYEGPVEGRTQESQDLYVAVVKEAGASLVVTYVAPLYIEAEWVRIQKFEPSWLAERTMIEFEYQYTRSRCTPRGYTNIAGVYEFQGDDCRPNLSWGEPVAHTVGAGGGNVSEHWWTKTTLHPVDNQGFRVSRERRTQVVSYGSEPSGEPTSWATMPERSVMVGPR